MADKPKVFVTRRIPAAGLDRILRGSAPLKSGTAPMPPPYATLKEKAADCDGLVSLLTDRIDPALLDAAPRLKVVSNYAVGFNNVDVPAATVRGVVVGNTPGVLTDATADMAFCLLDRGRPPSDRRSRLFPIRQVENVGAARPSRPRPSRPHPRRRRHGPHRLRLGEALSSRLGYAGSLSRPCTATRRRRPNLVPVRWTLRCCCANRISSPSTRI